MARSLRRRARLGCGHSSARPVRHGLSDRIVFVPLARLMPAVRKPLLTRRSVTLAVILIVGLSLSALAHQRPRARIPDIEEIEHNLYLLAASDTRGPATFTGGNIAVFVTEGAAQFSSTRSCLATGRTSSTKSRR